jgi:hypothetical protein
MAQELLVMREQLQRVQQGGPAAAAPPRPLPAARGSAGGGGSSSADLEHSTRGLQARGALAAAFITTAMGALRN